METITHNQSFADYGTSTLIMSYTLVYKKGTNIKTREAVAVSSY